jgi:hypothetical protein
LKAKSSYKTKKRAEEVAEALRRQGWSGVMVRKREVKDWRNMKRSVRWVVYVGSKEVLD